MARLFTSKIVRSYIAGFIDGEGSIGIHKRTRNGKISFVWYLSVVNTDKEVIQYIRDVIGFGVVRTTNLTNARLGFKPCYGLYYSHTQAKKILKAIYPYLRVKKKQAGIIIFLPKRYPGFQPKNNKEVYTKQEQAYLKLKKIHGRREQI